jgi:hypothetical protein
MTLELQQPTAIRTNRKRIEGYDELIRQAHARAESSEAASVPVRRAHLKLIARLDARCRREIQRREDSTRS